MGALTSAGIPLASAEALLVPPRRWIFILILSQILIGIGVCLYPQTLGHSRSKQSLSEVGELKELPLEAGKSLSLSEVLEMDQEGKFSRMGSGGRAVIQNRQPHEEKWFRIQISNPSNRPLRAVLELNRRNYDYAELYRKDARNEWKAVLSGQKYKSEEPGVSPRWMAFDWEQKPVSSDVGYLRVKDYYFVPGELFWWGDSEDFIRWERYFFARNFGFFCLWSGVVSYSAYLYLILRHRVQWNYLCYVILMGISLQLGDPLHHPTFLKFRGFFPLEEFIGGVFICLAMVQFCEFSRSFLNLKGGFSGWDRGMSVLRRCWWIVLAVSWVILWPPWALVYMKAVMILMVVSMGGTLFMGGRCALKGAAEAPFYLLGFSPIAVGLILYLLNDGGATSEVENLRWIMRVMMILSMIFFGYANAFNYKVALDEKYHLQARYLQDLEGEVAARTRELKELNQHLEKAVGERDRILGVIGHDLRAPTSSLYFFTRVLANEKVPLGRKELTEMSVKIGHACTMQLELLNNLLVWGTSRYWRSQQRAEPVLLRTAVQETFRMFQSGVRAKRIVLINAVPEGLELLADRSLLQTILRNLISNGIKFSRENGSIEVRATGLETGQVEIRVVDDGVGIDLERLRKLFVSSGESMPGTAAERGAGIGLNLCDDIVQSMGGSIRLESEPGKGTTAIFTLPGVSQEGNIEHRTLNVQHRTLK